MILPALAEAGWSVDQIQAEFPVRADRIITSGGIRRELGDGRVDYVLEAVPGIPCAVVEAKRAYRAASDGVQQAVRYGEQLDVPIAYSCNGSQIIERDLVAGTERLVDGFLTPAEAWARYAAQHGLDEDGQLLLSQAFNRLRVDVAGDIVQPRWYQTVAIHRVLAAIARREQRVLLLMATGTGKTFTALQIVHKLRSYERVTRPERSYRVLYLADRDVLVDQPQRRDFLPAFGGDPLRRVGGRADRSREIYFATYQALSAGDEDALFRDFPEDFFDLVIVDECHRGSAAENSSWRRILDHFSSAVQVGLTATPKQDSTVDTYGYFGDAVFTYSLRDGIADGFLAPYRVRRVVASPDADGWEPGEGQVDRDGRTIPEGTYSTRDFERRLRLTERTRLVAAHLSSILRRDPKARTMVFCVDQEHADEMRRSLIRANPDLVAADPEWVVRITGDEGERRRLLEDFVDPDRDSPTVATTSRLLATGVDVQDLKYVVIFRPISSSVEFKQIVGRGTRLYPEKGKVFFEIIDYTGATSHFADPDFDGFPVRTRAEPLVPAPDPIDEPDQRGPVDPADPTPASDQVAEPVPTFMVTDPVAPLDGQTVTSATTRGWSPYVVDEGDFFVVAEGVQVPDTSTGRLVLTEYGTFVAGQVKRMAPSPEALADRWSRAPTRSEAVAELTAQGVDLAELGRMVGADTDVFDLLVQLAWNVPARTRAERARGARAQHHEELERMGAAARQVLDGLLDRYAAEGIEEVTSGEVLRTPPLDALGSPRDIAASLGGRDRLHATIETAQQWIYSSKVVS